MGAASLVSAPPGRLGSDRSVAAHVAGSHEPTRGGSVFHGHRVDLEASVAQQLVEGRVLTYDLIGEADASTCNAVGDAIVARLG